MRTHIHADAFARPSTGGTPALRGLRTGAGATLALLALAACGGGGAPATGPGTNPPAQNPPGQGPAAPAILEFGADKAAYFVGERATLTVRFTGGAARIEPDVGAVQSGQAVQTAVLDGTRELRLVVENAQGGGAVARTLRLPVDYRDRWREVPMRFTSRGHSATLADDGRVVLIGGSRGESTLSFSVDVYDPGSGGFRRIGQLRNGREGHSATRLPDGRILVVGGEVALAGPVAEVVDERTGAVTATGAPAVRRMSHAAVHLGNGRVLLAGGYTVGENAAFGVSNTAEVWDAATGQFRPLAARMNARRVGHSASVLPDGRVLIAGGLASTPQSSYALAEIYDPRTETFTVVPSPDERQRGFGPSAQLPDGAVVLLGGESHTEAHDSVLRFRADGTGAEVLGRLPRPRTLLQAVTARDGRVFLFGGDRAPPGSVAAVTDAAESWTPQGGATPVASLPHPRVGHTATRLRDGRILIVGGENAAGGLLPAALIYE